MFGPTLSNTNCRISALVISGISRPEPVPLSAPCNEGQPLLPPVGNRLLCFSVSLYYAKLNRTSDYGERKRSDEQRYRKTEPAVQNRLGLSRMKRSSSCFGPLTSCRNESVARE